MRRAASEKACQLTVVFASSVSFGNDATCLELFNLGVLFPNSRPPVCSDLQQIQSAITGTLSPQGIVVPASALQQGNVTMATVAGMAMDGGTPFPELCRKTPS